MLQKHYQHLGRVSVDSDFDDDWKEEVVSKVEACGRMSGSCDDAFLDKGIEKAEIAKCLKNNKTGGSDGLVGELLKFWMFSLLEQPRLWRELHVRKGIERIQGTTEVLHCTLLCVVFCKVLNNRLVQCLDKGGVLHEGQAGF